MFKLTEVNLVIRAILFGTVGWMCVLRLEKPLGTVTVAWIIGIILILFGIYTFFMERKDSNARPVNLHLISAVLMAVVGLLVIIYPHIIAILLGIFVFLEGVYFVITSIRYKKADVSHWWVLLVVGLLAAISGILASVSPWFSIFTLKYIFGFGLIMLSVGCITALFGLSNVRNILDK